MNVFIVLETNTFGGGWGGVRTHFALLTNALVPETNSSKTRFQTSPAHRLSYSYQRLSNRTYLEMIASHRYSPSKTGGSYHALVLASKYATLTTFSVEHALICKTGGFLAVRHNEEKDVTATLLSEVFME